MPKKTGLGYEQLDAAFRHRNLDPLYFLFGEETFLIDELTATLRVHALEEHERDFNFDLIYGAEAEAAQVLGLCQQYPVMAERRLVVVRDFDKLSGNRLFTEYAKQPNETAVVLLSCAGKPNLSQHPYRALKKHAAWSHFKPLYDREVPSWILQRARKDGLDLQPQAVQMLAEFVGANLRSAVAELEKLKTYAAGRAKEGRHGIVLTAEDVLAASGQTREFNVFELQKAIGEGRRADAHRIAGRMLAQASNATGEGIMIVAVLNAYFTKLWKLHGCKRRGLGQKQMAREVGVPPYFLKEYLAALARFSPAALEAVFAALLAADYELKGGAPRSAPLVMTLMLNRLLPSGA